MTDIDTGLNVWQMTSNHNRMIEVQADRSAPRDGPVEIAYYGSSAFRITSPKGVSVMIDPWRNHPSQPRVAGTGTSTTSPSPPPTSGRPPTRTSTTTPCTGSMPTCCSTGSSAGTPSPT